MTVKDTHNETAGHKPFVPSPHAPLPEVLDGAMRRLMWLERTWLKQALANYDLDIAHYMLLLQLFKREGMCPMGELSQTLDLPNATTTGHVDRLEQKKLVRREYGNLQDRRQVRVHLSPQGKALALKVKELRLQHVKQALNQIQEQDREFFVRILTEFLDKLESAK